MGRRKVTYVLPHLNDCKGNLSAQWYVEYSCRNPHNGKLERFRIYEGLNDDHDAAARTAKAQVVIDHLTKKIASGWNPFDTKKEIISNHLLFNSERRIIGTQEVDRNLSYYINQFLDYRKPTLAYKSFLDYTSKLRLFSLWLDRENMRGAFPCEISRDVMERYVLFLISEKKEKKTIKNTKDILRRFFKYLVEKLVIKENPVVDLPDGRKIRDYSAQAMSAEEASFLLKYIRSRDEQTYLFCAVMFYCAIRPGTELRMLQIKDLNFFNGTIKIQEGNAKTTEAIINIPPPLMEIFLELKINSYDREFYLFGKERVPGKEHWGMEHFRKNFNRFRDEIKFPKEYKLYSWKCTGAILFLKNGAPIDAVRDHLRHQHTTTTDIYLSKKLGKQNDYVKNKFPKI